MLESKGYNGIRQIKGLNHLYTFEMVMSFVCLVPEPLLLSNMVVLYYISDQQQRVYSMTSHIESIFFFSTLQT